MSIIKKISIKIINECNLRCPYCFAERSGQKGHMFLDDYSWVIQFCSENGVENIRITGGEPFLHPHIHQFIEKALKQHLEVVLYSNFTVAHCIERIKTVISPPKINILVNINKKDFYTKTQLKQIHHNILCAKNRGVSLYVGYNVYELPIDISHVLEIASQYEIKGIRISQASPDFSSSNKSLSLAELPQFLKNLTIIAKQLEQVGIRVNADCPVPLCFIDAQEKEYLTKKVMVRGYCGERLGVYQDLTVAHCYVTQKMIKQKNLKDFITYEDALNFVGREIDLINERQQKLKGCKVCESLTNKQAVGVMVYMGVTAYR